LSQVLLIVEATVGILLLSAGQVADAQESASLF